jgi:hypothetical protein
MLEYPSCLNGSRDKGNRENRDKIPGPQTPGSVPIVGVQLGMHDYPRNYQSSNVKGFSAPGSAKPREQRQGQQKKRGINKYALPGAE